MGYFYSDEELAHHGILGQKWGVRRFENEDGTLTAAGRSRYDTDSNGNYKKVSKGSDAYSQYKRAIKAADKAESKYNSNTSNDKAREEWGKYLKEADTAKKNFNKYDKKKFKEDKKQAKAYKVTVDEKGNVTREVINKKGLTDDQKKALKTSAAIAGTILVAYGGYKLATSPKARAIANDILQGNKAKRMADIDKEIASMGPEIVKKKATDVTKKAVNTVKPDLADKKQADIAKKAVKTMSEGLQSSSPAKFEYEKFMPEKFDFEKFEYENNELVDGLLKKNARMLGL